MKRALAAVAAAVALAAFGSSSSVEALNNDPVDPDGAWGSIVAPDDPGDPGAWGSVVALVP